ncbi:SUMO-specific isopeptidase USPL1 isoform X2 [Talpa occidentalis]|uniref:SUMO-specific isopeptidase USPL1 isoform X2 n=1 Tax=Talpa occidentalis TaxID=50954 RepID=UPI00188F6121|nr:SUMO-specific isopeptidase USPL1 isoform X2 [Talpa occidentalis]
MMDSPKIGNGLPVIGPGTDIGNSDSAKVPSDGYCPACREKGKLKALKTYRISFQESIFLCEDLQCIYPLCSKSLNLISPDLEDCHIPNKPQKRKLLETNYKDSPLLANSKKTKNHTDIDGEQVLNSKQYEEVYDKTSSYLPDLLHSDQQKSIGTADFMGQNETLEDDTLDTAAEETPTIVNVSRTGGTSPQNEGCMSEREMPQESTSSCQTLYPQWKNAYALCWLDCILSVLVHLEGLKSTVTDLCTEEESVFWQLFTKYNEANKLLHTNHLDGSKDGDCKNLTKDLIAKIETSLNEVRSEVFIRLQPHLRCTLGDMESPVFAFPLLLKIEPHIEKLFMYSFSWNFECSQCGHKYQNRCMKSLVTFTNVISEWHPLNAAHFGPCNKCNNKSQIRKMELEKVSSIFMLHFVEGLPHNDLRCYSFCFEDCHYQITSVIQYQTNNHFITWILDAGGGWLECDDLKGPCSERREKFEVPASEIHIVIWERKIPEKADEAASYLPLKKTNDQHTFGGEKQVSPALCSAPDAASAEMSSGTHPTNTSVAPNTLSQDETVAHGDHLLSGPKDLVDSNDILPFTFDELLVTADDLPLENKCMAEKAEVVKITNALCSQESLMAFSVSATSKEELTQDQFVDLTFPSQVVNTNMQPIQQLNTEDTVIAKPVNNSHATDPIQLIKPVEIEGIVALGKDTSSKTEKLKPEQHVTSLMPNLKKKEMAASYQTLTSKSLQNPSLKETPKKPFVGSWVKGLLSKGASFMPSCVSAHNRNTITDLQPSIKGASNFGGFKTKGVNQKANRAPRKAHGCAGKPSARNPAPSHSSASTASNLCAPDNVDSEVLKKCENTSYGVHLNQSYHGNENGVSSANHGDSFEDQIHKLRLKLLRKLKAKKKKLAALMSFSQNETLPSENSEHVSHCDSPNDCQAIEDLLKELQYQIDIADNKSGYSTVPGVSPYNTQTHEEILAELLSPTTVVSTELSENGENDFRYLEMGDNQVPASVPSELTNIPQNTHLKQDHNYYSPNKKNQCEAQPDSLVNNACVRTLSLESSMKTDIFDDFFSTSTFNSLANDTLELPHFDEYLFESC